MHGFCRSNAIANCKTQNSKRNFPICILQFAFCIFPLLVLCGAQVLPPAAPSAAAGAGPLDLPLRLIADARQSYQGVRDYTCLFIKRERLRGQVQPENVIDMKVRTQPFSVYLRWLKPTATAGQEV